MESMARLSLNFGMILPGINFKMQNFKLRTSVFYSRSGFTFIELLLYVALFGTMLSALVPFTWAGIQTGVKSMVQQEVNQNTRYISERIGYEIRNASGITSVSTNSATLSTFIPATNPTVITFSGGNLTITQGASPAAQLNSNNTTLSNFSFTNFSSGDSKTKHIQYKFTVSANFNSSAQTYQDSTSIEESAEVRSN